MPKTNKPTLKSIADRLGLTANTVSLALRDSPLVQPSTKARIYQTAREMGYVHNVLAGAMRSGQSHTVALIFGDVSNPIFAQRIRSLSRLLQEKGYQTLILNTDEDPAAETAAIRTAISYQVDGVILCPCQKNGDSLALLTQHRVPCVLLGREFPDAPFDTVTWDDREGARLAAAHLLAQGCRRPVFLSGPAFISSAALRREGYEAVMRENGLSPLTIYADVASGGAEACLEALDGYDALFAFSDLMALEAASTLLSRGIRIPQDVAVCGFDDVGSLFRMPFSLTSIACDRALEAERTVAQLLNRIQHPDVAPRLERLPVRLIARGSTRRDFKQEEVSHE